MQTIVVDNFGLALAELCITLWFQLEDTGLLIGTFILFDPVLFKGAIIKLYFF